MVVPHLRVDRAHAPEAIPAGGMSQDDFPAIDFGMWLRMAAARLGVRVHRRDARRLPHPRRQALGGVRAAQGPRLCPGHEIVSRLKEVKRRFVETGTPARGAAAVPAARSAGAAPRAAGHGSQRHASRAASGSDFPRPLGHPRRPGSLLEPPRGGLRARACSPALVDRKRRKERGRRREGRDPRRRPGSRIQEETESKPKPMVEIGGRPMLWHIMKLYAHRGLQRVRGCARLQGRLHQALDARVLVAPGRPHRLAKDGQGRVLEGEREDWQVALVTRARGQTGYGHVSYSSPGSLAPLFRPPASSRSCSSSSTTASTSSIEARPGDGERPGARRSRPMNPVYLEEIDGALSDSASRRGSRPVERRNAASKRRSASSCGSAAGAVQSSGPRERPVRARRRARRSPPTAFSSRTVSRGSPPASWAKRRWWGARPWGASTAQARGSGSRTRAPRSGHVHLGAPARARAARRHGRSAPRRRARRWCRSPAAGSAAGRSARRDAGSRAPPGARARPPPGSRPRAAARRSPSARFELLPCSPRIRPWWINSVGSPRGLGRPPVQLLVRAVVVAAHDVRDVEVDVVHHTRQVVGRRAVLAHQRHAVEALTERRPGLEVTLAPLALAHRAFVPIEPEPREVAQQLLLAAGHVASRVGVVDPQQQPVGERPRRDRAERVADVERPGRAGSEACAPHGAESSDRCDR